MKNLYLLIISVLSVSAYAQKHTETITKTLTFEKVSAANALMIANLNGNINVIGYAGSEIIVEITKTITAKTEARLAEGKSRIELGIINNVDSLVLYVKGACSTFSKHHIRGQNNSWAKFGSYGWNNSDKDCTEGFSYTLDFKIKVPAGIHVVVSTINDGEIVVENVNGIVRAHNINGGIALKNLIREASASTINGNVTVDYAKNPINDCRFYSLNGDINASFEKGLAANFSFESFNGDFYTDIEPLQALPSKVEKTKVGKGVKYKVNGSQYKIRTGGPLLDFETFNGNLKERKN
jgi:hypothetical protein